ncbi:MAG: hypothetical protein ACXW3Z_16855 [Limisphaerales bacterium]
MSHFSKESETLADWQRWKPRQPAPKVYARIFGREQETDMSFHLRDLTRWLVPAFGCFLLVMAHLSAHLPGRYSMQMSDGATTNLGEQLSMATIPGAQRHSGVNSYPARSYEVTFGARPSTAALNAASILFSYTNKLINQ